jgi:cytochrome c2
MAKQSTTPVARPGQNLIRLTTLGQWGTLLLLALWLSACAPLIEFAGVSTNETRIQTDAMIVTGGDADRGAIALRAYGCDACHTIPGITGANSLVGPPLNGWADRKYIAGKFPNEPAYLIDWIRFPQSYEPGTAMPNLGVTEQDARDMSAYLYTVGRD